MKQPMPRSFAFTASHEFGELQLGGYDPESIDPTDSMKLFKMVRDDYGVKVSTSKSDRSAAHIKRIHPAD